MKALFYGLKGIGKITDEVGSVTESRFCEMLEKAKSEDRLPPWLLGWKRTGKYSVSDWKGMDVLIYTDRGLLKINLKSSRQLKIFAEKQHPNSDIIVIDFNTLVKDE